MKAIPPPIGLLKREETIPVTVETPTEYSDSSGKVKYSFRMAYGRSYSYSTGEVVLDSEDEELAMLLLNMDGSYDGYELVSVVCDRIEEEGNAAGYSYQVLYRKAEPLEGTRRNRASDCKPRLFRHRRQRRRSYRRKSPSWWKRKCLPGNTGILDGRTKTDMPAIMMKMASG